MLFGIIEINAGICHRFGDSPLINHLKSALIKLVVGFHLDSVRLILALIVFFAGLINDGKNRNPCIRRRVLLQSGHCCRNGGLIVLRSGVLWGAAYQCRNNQ